MLLLPLVPFVPRPWSIWTEEHASANGRELYSWAGGGRRAFGQWQRRSNESKRTGIRRREQGDVSSNGSRAEGGRRIRMTFELTGVSSSS